MPPAVSSKESYLTTLYDRLEKNVAGDIEQFFAEEFAGIKAELDQLDRLAEQAGNGEAW